MKQSRIKTALAAAKAALLAENAAFQAFVPCPRACERDAWGAVDEKLAAEFLSQAEKLLPRGFCHIPASLYLDFSRTGNRKRFEDAYFGRRIQLNLFVLAECIEHRGRFLDAIIDGVYALCEESGWALPAHNSYERNRPQLPLPDSCQPVLDLFACETGGQLALIHYLLQSELDGVSPLICSRIRRELKNRMFTPYLTHRFWWMGYERQPTNNWTVWCTQNMLIAAALPGILDDAAAGSGGRAEKSADGAEAAAEKGGGRKGLLSRILDRAAYSIDRFLSEYGEDGCCDEGALYYRHAGLCLFGALSVMKAVCGPAFAPLSGDRQIRNIAEYIVHMHAAGRYYFNFSDCPACAGYAGVREYLFGQAVDSPLLTDFAAEGWKMRHAASPIHDYASSDDMLNLLYLLQELFASPKILASEKKESGGLEARRMDNWAYPSVGIYLSRSSRYALAVKAGCNADNHNHNDTGSFILYKDGKPFIIDVGVETYSQKTFSSRRYEIWTMQSAFHNVSNFDSAMQKDGPQYRARRVAYRPDDSRMKVTMRLEQAYGPDSRLTRYERQVLHDMDGGIRVRDRVQGDFDTAFFTLMTQEEPVLVESAPGTAASLTVAVGSLGRILVTGDGRQSLEAARVSIEPIAVTDGRLRQSWPEKLWRLRISYRGELTAAFV